MSFDAVDIRRVSGSGLRRLAWLGLGLVIAAFAGYHAGRLDKRHSDVPVPVTLGALTSDPDRYSGRTVQLEGRLDECFGWECAICPEEMTAETADARLCLPLEFRPLLPGTGFGGDAKEAVFRFATVTLNARFDPSCLRGRCTDRATVLLDADVVAVRRLGDSRSGLWLGRRTRLIPLPAPAADAVAAAARKAGMPEGSSRREKDPRLAAAMRAFDPRVRVFGVKGDKDVAVICSLPAGETDAGWPDSLEGALDAPGSKDHYRCHGARKIADAWLLQIGNW